MIDLTMSMTRKRIEDLEQRSLEAITEARRLLRDARLLQAKLSPKPRTTFLWSRWTQRIREIRVGK
jgi:hypothetical protein